MSIYTTFDSPAGELLLVGERSETARGGLALVSVSFTDMGAAREGEPDREAFAEVERQLSEYFAGERTGFELDLVRRGTAFQERVWAALDGLPYGVTTTYGRLAEQLEVPRDRIRAVGGAIGANPLLIVRPCHRVIGASGSLTGYAGGVERKRFLLTHEGALQPLFV
ncbi:methylated-DNA--[protein]-cysteine S-methyltransferase [Nonomuraea mangrovi]|uniref:Methylated-DNA--[protein]-cysteine S-methyltransferase n=1 Tax=Nonomuraea mangrovi TaxID=2316207 RepID=A0ABW4TCJ9_9ACTN